MSPLSHLKVIAKSLFDLSKSIAWLRLSVGCVLWAGGASRM